MIELEIAGQAISLPDEQREKLRDIANAESTPVLVALLKDLADIKLHSMRENVVLGRHEDARGEEGYALACEELSTLLKTGLKEALKEKD